MKASKGSMVSLFTLEVLTQYFKCSNDNPLSANPTKWSKNTQTIRITSKVALFAKKLYAVNCFYKKISYLIFGRVLITPMKQSKSRLFLN